MRDSPKPTNSSRFGQTAFPIWPRVLPTVRRRLFACALFIVASLSGAMPGFGILASAEAEVPLDLAESVEAIISVRPSEVVRRHWDCWLGLISPHSEPSNRRAENAAVRATHTGHRLTGCLLAPLRC